jgi:hypothetical protein
VYVFVREKETRKERERKRGKEREEGREREREREKRRRGIDASGILRGSRRRDPTGYAAKALFCQQSMEADVN